MDDDPSKPLENTEPGNVPLQEDTQTILLKQDVIPPPEFKDSSKQDETKQGGDTAGESVEELSKSNDCSFTMIQQSLPSATDKSNGMPQYDSSLSPDARDSRCLSQSEASEITSKITTNFVEEAERLETFSNWTTPFVSKEDLARTGFVCVYYQDFVQCAFCNGIVGDWEEGDIPRLEHLRFFPGCPFLKGQDVGNVPIIDKSLPSSTEVAQTTYDTMPLSSNPRYPNYDSLQKRLDTFKEWPSNVPQEPRILVAAGLYYAGIFDHVTCFHCGRGLRNWEEEDNPWLLHLTLLGNCNFLQDLYNKIQKNSSSIETPITAHDNACEGEELLDEFNFNAMKDLFLSMGTKPLYDAAIAQNSSLEQSILNVPVDEEEAKENSEN